MRLSACKISKFHIHNFDWKQGKMDRHFNNVVNGEIKANTFKRLAKIEIWFLKIGRD